MAASTTAIETFIYLVYIYLFSKRAKKKMKTKIINQIQRSIRRFDGPSFPFFNPAFTLRRAKIKKINKRKMVDIKRSEV